MIENAWKWAAQNGKVYRHPVNQAEYIDIDVDSVRERQKQRVSELSTAATFVTEAGPFVRTALLCCLCAYFFALIGPVGISF